MQVVGDVSRAEAALLQMAKTDASGFLYVICQLLKTHQDKLR